MSPVRGGTDVTPPGAAPAVVRAIGVLDALAASPDGVMSLSDLSRALETARIVAEAQGLSVTTDIGLRERCFGAFEGRTFAEVSAAWPAEAERWRRRDPDWVPPGGGESLLSFRERVTQTVQVLAAQNAGKTLALFTHGGVLDVLYRAATGLGLQDARTWQIGNTAVNRLLWTPDSGLSLVGWADTGHLETSSLDEAIT